MSLSQLVIALDGFKPTLCDPPLYKALGYKSERDCIKRFRDYPHFRNVNLLQVYGLALRGERLSLTLINRKGRVAGIVCKLEVDAARSFLQLEVDTDPGSTASDGLVHLNLEDLSALILVEDKPWVEALLLHDRLEAGHSFCYRLAGSDGVVLPVRHTINKVFPADRSALLNCRLVKVDEEQLDRVSTSTLAMVFGLETETSQLVMLPDFYRLAPLITELREMLRQDGIKDRISVGAENFADCSICDHSTHQGRDETSACLQLLLPDLSLSLEQLRLLVTSEHSLFRINGKSAWKSWFSRVHAQGYHLSIGLDSTSRVTLGILADYR